MQIRNGTPWLYLGGEQGYNLVHMIVNVEDKTDPKMPRIMSYSLYDQETEEESGWVWEGPLSQFIKLFKPLGPADEAGV